MTKLMSNVSRLIGVRVLVGLAAFLLASTSLAQVGGGNADRPAGSPQSAAELKRFQPMEERSASDADSNSPKLRSRPQALSAMGTDKTAASGAARMYRSTSQPPARSMRCNPGKSPNQAGGCQ